MVTGSARDEVMDTADMIGVHDQHGWLWQTPKDGQGGEGSVWDRWGDNLENTKKEMWESYTAWSKRDEDPEYSNFTIGANAVMMTGGLPLKLIKGLLSSSSGGPTGPTPSDGHSPGSDGPRTTAPEPETTMADRSIPVTRTKAIRTIRLARNQHENKKMTPTARTTVSLLWNIRRDLPREFLKTSSKKAQN